MDDFSTDEFIQGFLEESGEHIQAIHRNLMLLEDRMVHAGDEPDPEKAQAIDDLFRSFHTIKGLAGMVRLDEAATLSHAIESLLQSIRAGKRSLEVSLLDLMVESVRALEAEIDSVRQPPADGSAAEQRAAGNRRIVERVHAAADGRAAAESRAPVESREAPQEPASSPRPPAPAEPAAQPAAPESSLAVPGREEIVAVLPDLSGYPNILASLGDLERQRIWQAARERQFFALAFFSPSAEKSARGMNVDQVRQQLGEAGSILKAVPVLQGRGVQFAFLVSARAALEAGSLPVDELVPLAVRAPVSPQRATSRSYGAGGKATFIRVELARLDDLVQYTSDMVILRARLEESLKHLQGAPVAARRELDVVSSQLGRTLKGLRQAILRARMVPLAEAFNPMPLVVRDLARSTGKNARLVIEGEKTEVDKVLVEGLLDPLVHLVRNALIHGIEPPEERARLGKPAQGTILLRGTPEGDRILIEVGDDGRGLDFQRIQAKARSLGLPEGALDRPLTGDEVLALVSRPGFSTREQADMGAGRGVGLDIVYKMVRSFGGTLALSTTPGKGTTLSIRLPLTLLMMDGLIVQAGSERYAAPRSMVDEVIAIDPAAIVQAESGELYQHRGHPVVLHRLNRLLSIPNGTADGAGLAGLLRRLPDRQDALVVDRVLELRELVVHPFTDPLVAQPGIEGATELGDGQVVLILNLPALFHGSL